MKSLLLFLSLGATVAAAPNHALFSAVLATHVKDGRVDYHTLKADPRLPQYLDQLAATDPATLASDPERLALWLNAYNAYTLKLIIDREPAKSITELGTGGIVLGSLLKTTAWDIRFATVGGKKFTLNEIEHEIIRRQFKDSRAHFALNCASGSCPILRREAYEAGTLERQLDEQGRLFVQDAAKNRFDSPRRRPSSPAFSNGIALTSARTTAARCWRRRNTRRLRCGWRSKPTRRDGRWNFSPTTGR